MITITVQRHKIYGRIMGDNIIEDRKEPMETYKREKTDINVKDIGELKNKFIEEVAREVSVKNKEEERKFKQKRTGTFLRLTIININ